MVNITQITHTLDDWLQPHLFNDYCPNGLQVEGDSRKIHRIACAVTASQSVIEQAVANHADVLLVHHGIMWRGDSPVITGSKKKRIQLLLDNGLHLLGYHLPLDAHAELGNNAQLAVELDWVIEKTANDKADSLLYTGHLRQPASASALAQRIEQQFKRTPLLLGDGDTHIQTIAWCSGAGQGFFGQAIDLGVDAYMTGEVSEQNYHQAEESGCCFIAAGHHATERYGVQALGKKLNDVFGVQCWFIDQNNPV